MTSNIIDGTIQPVFITHATEDDDTNYHDQPVDQLIAGNIIDHITDRAYCHHHSHPSDDEFTDDMIMYVIITTNNMTTPSST
jgi:hypothetical protein